MISTSEKTSLEYKIPSEMRNCLINSELSNIIPYGNKCVKKTENEYVCSLCKKSFTNKILFAKHSASHDKNCALFLPKIIKTEFSNNTLVLRPFKCNLCGLVFDRISQYDNHKRSVHSRERSQVCRICGKGFFRQTDLKTHINIHLGTNKSVCEICGRKFNHVSNLTRHSRTHSGVKPYPCTICGKRFTQINTLARHKAIHERGDEIIDCSLCGRRYKSKSSLREHMRKLHRFMEKSNSGDNGRIIKRQHYCKICGESFQFVEVLRVHEKSHQNVKIFECKSCDKKFQKADEIKEHKCGRVKLLDRKVIGIRKKVSKEGSIDGVIKNKRESNLSKENEIVLTQLVGSNEENYRAEANLNEVNTLMENQRRINGLKTFIDDELSEKLYTETIINSNKLAEDNKKTKETIVYVTTEQLAHMNTEQVVDTANHFLHQHLMELAAENSTHTENIAARDCDSETVVSEMINNCWREIEMPDVTDSEVLEKKDSSSNSKNNTQSIIYIHALEKDGLIFLNETGGNLVEDIAPDRTWIRNSSSVENDHIPMIETTNTPLTCNISEELLKDNCNNVNNNAVIAKSLENSEPKLRLVQTENGEEFYELLITNCSDKLIENSFEIDRISTIVDTGNENLSTVENDGQRVLKLTSCSLSDEAANRQNGDNVAESTVNNNRFIETSNVLENIDEEGTSGVENSVSNKCEKIFYLTQNNKDNMIDFFEIETLGTQEQNSFNLVSDEVMEENVSQTSFDRLQTMNKSENLVGEDSPIDNESCEELLGLIQSNAVKLNEKSKMEFKKTVREVEEEGPMVRLVQNEDGAQFFELIRGDLEFEETQDFQLIETNDLEERQNSNVQISINDTNNAENFYLEFGSTINDNNKLETDIINRKKKQKNNAKKYNCDVCKKSFSKGYNYRQHIGTHFADQQKFKCKECGTLFAWKSTLNKHMATHRAGGQLKFVCKICPKVYTTLSQVNEHVKRDHLKERNHKCDRCAKTFFKKFDLKIHTRTHTKERPYECNVCYKSFHHQSHIIRHERIHSGERPYACNICEKTFTQLGSLKNHRLRHQELKIDILDYQMDEDDPLPRNTL